MADMLLAFGLLVLYGLLTYYAGVLYERARWER